MNLQGLGKIETPDKYLDVAFARATKESDLARDQLIGKKKSKIDRSRSIELSKLNAISTALTKPLAKILKSFPTFDDLPRFYQELIKCTLEFSDFKQSLGALNWANEKIHEFTRIYTSTINRTKDLSAVNRYRREYYGRVSSVMKKLKKELEYLDECRRVMREYPQIKTSLKSVAIVGFPNVGKTTLLYKLTGSKPEINSYAFTTKGINVGVLESDVKHGMKKIQVLDTPGTLNRFNKMNNIEKQAYLAFNYVADLIIYVFDLTEGYPLEDQKNLFLKVNGFDTDVIVYMSKTDILDKKVIDKFKDEFLQKNKMKSFDIGTIKNVIIDTLANETG
jgi:nucleolar GTP-binding protein